MTNILMEVSDLDMTAEYLRAHHGSLSPQRCMTNHRLSILQVFYILAENLYLILFLLSFTDEVLSLPRSFSSKFLYLVLFLFKNEDVIFPVMVFPFSVIQCFEQFTGFGTKLCDEARKNTETFAIFIQCHITIVKLNTLIKLLK